jgi:hypothetical protein
MRRAAKVDGNARQLVAALRAVGASVFVIGRPVDLLVGFRRRNYVIEVKRPHVKPRKDQQAQRDFIEAWQGEIVTVQAVDEALQAIGAIL